MKKSLVAAASALLLAACSDGLGGSSGTPTPNTDPGGYYEGTLDNSFTGSTDTLVGLIDDNGKGVFIDETNFAVLRITRLVVSGNDIAGDLQAYAAPGSQFPNGSSVDAGTFVGSVAEHSSASGSATLDGGAADAFSLTYESSLYQLGASFTTIAGSYNFQAQTTAGTDSGTFTVDSNGTFSGSDTLGCTISGLAIIPNAAYNAYELSGSTVCPATTIDFTGLATYAPASGGTPAQLTLEYDNGSSFAAVATAVLQ